MKRGIFKLSCLLGGAFLSVSAANAATEIWDFNGTRTSDNLLLIDVQLTIDSTTKAILDATGTIGPGAGGGTISGLSLPSTHGAYFLDPSLFNASNPGGTAWMNGFFDVTGGSDNAAGLLAVGSTSEVLSFCSAASCTSNNLNAYTDVGVAFTLKQIESGVPEPASWAMMIAGLGLAGFAMRRGRRETVSIRYA